MPDGIAANPRDLSLMNLPSEPWAFKSPQAAIGEYRQLDST